MLILLPSRKGQNIPYQELKYKEEHTRTIREIQIPSVKVKWEMTAVYRTMKRFPGKEDI